MSDVLLIVISKPQIYLYLVAVLATFLLLKYHKGKKLNMPTRQQILDAVADYVNAEINLERTSLSYERREALVTAFERLDALEKLVTEATEGPF